LNEKKEISTRGELPSSGSVRCCAVRMIDLSHGGGMRRSPGSADVAEQSRTRIQGGSARILALCPAVCLAVALSGCSSVGTTTGVTTGAPATGVYVLQNTPASGSTAAAASILEFSPNATGSASASSTISAPSATALEFLAVDGLGNIYTSASASAGSSIDEYALGSTNSAAAKRSIPFDSTTGLTSLSALAVGATGEIYASGSAGSISTFSATATGSVAPTSSVSITSGVGPQASAVDASGNLYVATAPPANTTPIAPVVVFASGATAPSHSIAGALTLMQVGSPKSMATDSAGNLYVANVVAGVSSILVFGPGASGNTAPLRDISGTATMLGCVGGIAVDAEGYLYAVSTATCGSSANPTILKFSTTGDGNIAPVSSFTSAAWTHADAALSIAVY
jgi:uncharacterized protein YceK